MEVQQLVFTSKNRCVTKTLALPDGPGPGEVLIRNRYSLISAGTELAMFTRTHRGFDEPDFSYAKYPFYPGYAAVGEVLAVGDGVSDLAPGLRVFHRGRHATYALHSCDVVLPVPEGVPDSHVPFLSMLQIALSSIRQAPVYFGENVLVIGMGLVGNLCAQLCGLAGAGQVAAADLAAPRLAQAQACGVDLAFNLSEKPLLNGYRNLALAVRISWLRPWGAGRRLIWLSKRQRTTGASCCWGAHGTSWNSIPISTFTARACTSSARMPARWTPPRVNVTYRSYGRCWRRAASRWSHLLRTYCRIPRDKRRTRACATGRMSTSVCFWSTREAPRCPPRLALAGAPSFLRA